MMTQTSFFKTQLSFLKESHLHNPDKTTDSPQECPDSQKNIIQEDFAFFNELVREYCGKDILDIMEKTEYKEVTSKIWDEREMNPPDIYRIIIELLHLAASKDISP